MKNKRKEPVALCSGHREATWLRRSKQGSAPHTEVFSEPVSRADIPDQQRAPSQEYRTMCRHCRWKAGSILQGPGRESLLQLPSVCEAEKQRECGEKRLGVRRWGRGVSSSHG